MKQRDLRTMDTDCFCDLLLYRSARPALVGTAGRLTMCLTPLPGRRASEVLT